jgi:hypothetical protein
MDERMQAEIETELLVTLLGALGFRVHCGRSGAGAQDASGDFLMWGDWLYALTPEANALFLYLGFAPSVSISLTAKDSPSAVEDSPSAVVH